VIEQSVVDSWELIRLRPAGAGVGVTGRATGGGDANCRLGSLVHWCNDGTAMRYRLEIKEEARQQLRALAKEQRRNVGRRLDALQDNLSGDVKKLAAKTHEYRLRVGNLRVLFTLEKDLISVYAVRDRKKAYE
jgi:mRNA interferase RelE/StbE